MKKIILLLIASFFIFFSFNGINNALENCDYNGEGGLVKNLTKCIDEPNFKGVVPKANLDLSSGNGVSLLISSWVKKIASVLFIISVGALIYASYLLVLSGGEDEKVKKAKDIIKRVILGFIGLVSAGLIVMLLVKLGYFVTV